MNRLRLGGRSNTEVQEVVASMTFHPFSPARPTIAGGDFRALSSQCGSADSDCVRASLLLKLFTHFAWPNVRLLSSLEVISAAFTERGFAKRERLSRLPIASPRHGNGDAVITPFNERIYVIAIYTL
jgi:hypothetical protein